MRPMFRIALGACAVASMVGCLISDGECPPKGTLVSGLYTSRTSARSVIVDNDQKRVFVEERTDAGVVVETYRIVE